MEIGTNRDSRNDVCRWYGYHSGYREKSTTKLINSKEGVHKNKHEYQFKLDKELDHIQNKRRTQHKIKIKPSKKLQISAMNNWQYDKNGAEK